MMNNTASKLSKLENVQIREHIENYFNELNRKHRDFEDNGKKNKTVETYNSEIRMYFYMMRNKEKGKELEYLSMDDINITQEDYEAYIDLLCGLKNKNGGYLYVNKTINKKTTALKGLIRYLKKKKVIDIDISYLELIKGEKEKTNSYGALEVDEVILMSELALKEKDKGNIKRLLLLFDLKTGLRISEITDLKWNNFILKGEEVFVRGIGKGNKPYEIKIIKALYDELLTLNEGQEKVFNISARRVTDMMDRLKNKMNIQPERHITFHSVRKAFGTHIWRSTGDIEAARRALRHESVTTTQIYLGSGNYELNDTIFSIEKVDGDLFRNVNNEDLVEAISNLPKNIQLILNMKLQENLKGK